MKLKNKLICTFAIITVLISTAATIGSNQLANLASAYYIENEQLLPALSSLSDMKKTLPIVELEPSEYILKPDPEHPEELDEAEEFMNDSLLNYGKVAGRETAMDMKTDVDELFTMSREIITLRDNNAPEQVLDEKFDQLDNKIDEFHDKLDSERVRITEELTLSTESVKNSIQTTLYLTITLSGIAAAITVALTMYFSYAVSRPISKLKMAADQIGRGNYEVDTNISKSTDEIGELCIHFGKMKDELKNKEKMQNDFISIASHELRTPVQPILAYSELYSRGVVTADEAIKAISHEAKRLQRLANDILDVTKIESGRINYKMEKVVLNELLVDVVDSFRVSLSNRELRLNTALNSPEGLTIYADDIRIRQALSNIIGNAIKFTQKGEVTVHSQYYSDKNQLEISVVDSGPGISNEVLSNLFGKFVTKDSSTENQQGSGLGLFISKALIEAHGGTIVGQNNQTGTGSTFRILLPVHSLSTENQDTFSGKAASTN